MRFCFFVVLKADDRTTKNANVFCVFDSALEDFLRVKNSFELLLTNVKMFFCLNIKLENNTYRSL